MNDSQDLDHLSESMRHVENAALAHKAAVELAEQRRLQIQNLGERIQKLEIELRMAQRELDVVRIQAHDAQERADKATEQTMGLMEDKGNLEACLRNTAAIITDFYRQRQINPVIPPEVRPPSMSAEFPAEYVPRKPTRASDRLQDALKPNGGADDRPPAPPRPEPSQPFRRG